MKQLKKYRSLFLIIVVLVLANLLAATIHTRLDLTEDKRFSLSPASKALVEDVSSPLVVDVFLKGDFPPEFRRLQNETRYLLEEFQAFNPNIRFNFINPLAEAEDAGAVAQEFFEMGMPPARLNVLEKGKASETIIFPWAIANHGEKTVKIRLFRTRLGATDEELVNSSVQQLEYAFANGFSQLLRPRDKKIAVMRGNGELADRYLASFIQSVRQYYFVAPFTLDSAIVAPQRTLEQLKEFDLIIEAKPTQAYTEKEKYVLDQYLMQGGKALWLAEKTAMETDSLFNPTGRAFALPRDLNLTDLFFSYGFRINPALINDIYSAPIILTTGSGGESRFTPFPWFYSPLSTSTAEHPIVKNIEAVKFDWANPIDTLRNELKKTILLTSSPQTKVEGTPREISLDIIDKRPELSAYNAGEQPLAVLLEGKFRSAYRNRIKPFEIPAPVDESPETGMIVISDGDVIKNQLQRGEPLDLGFDRYTGNTYGNKEFLLNSVNYLLDDNGLIDIRTKEVSLPALNDRKVEEEREKWQLINLLVPVLLLMAGAAAYTAFRKRRYVKS